MSKRKKPIEKLDPLKLYAIAAFFSVVTPVFLFSSAPGGVCFSIPIAVLAWRRARRLQDKDPWLPGSRLVAAAARRWILVLRDRYSARTR